MTIKLEIEATNERDFLQQLRAVQAAMTAPEPQTLAGVSAGPYLKTMPLPANDNTPAAEPAEPPKRRGRKPAAPADAMPGESEAEIARDLTPKDDAPAVTKEKVVEALMALLDKQGEEAPPKLLAEFNAKKLSEIAEADYQKVIDRAKELAAA